MKLSKLSLAFFGSALLLSSAAVAGDSNKASIQLYEKVNASSLAQLQTEFDWSELRIYDNNEKGRNHGILLGTKGWAPR